MKTLSLVSPEASDILYRKIYYPDGQQDIVLLEQVSETAVVLESRLNSFADLELILCATSALRGTQSHGVVLRVPYLLGARSDRCFVQGGSSYLCEVIAPILNGQFYRKVQVLDPHSDAVDCIHGINRQDIGPFMACCKSNLPTLTKNVVLQPDDGAEKRSRVAAMLLGDLEIVKCRKKRDQATGEILETVVECDDFQGSNLIVVDDICDGGRTFIEIAKVARQRNCGKMFLIVTHGIFSQGLDPLLDWFHGIFCTDSVKQIIHRRVRQFSVFKE